MKDPDSFLFEIHAIAGWDMTGFDEWLGNPMHWPGHEVSRQELIDQRAELVHIFRTYYADTARIEVHANLLRKSAESTSMFVAGHRLQQASDRRNQQAKTAAQAPRPAARNPLLPRVKEMMRKAHLQDQSLKDFLDAWIKSPGDDLRIELISHTETFRITDEEGSLGSIEYKLTTLQRFFSESKPKLS